MKRAFPAGLSGTTAGWLFGSPTRAAVAAFSFPALGSPSGSPPPALSQRETVMRGDVCVLGCCLSQSAPRPRPASARPPASPLANSQTSGPLPCILFLASPLDEGKLFESKAFKKTGRSRPACGFFFIPPQRNDGVRRSGSTVGVLEVLMTSGFAGRRHPDPHSASNKWSGCGLGCVCRFSLPLKVYHHQL